MYIKMSKTLSARFYQERKTTKKSLKKISKSF